MVALTNKEIMFENRLDLSNIHQKIDAVKTEIKKIIVGQDEMIELLIAAILCRGHVLIEGFPGVAKTLTAKLLARTISTKFSRIQFTPDLMPSDVLGTSVFNFKSSEFDFKKGPIFSNIILIDEINRAPAKTQAALFEVMEERQITIDGHTYILEEPFLIVATQNPIDLEGTYRLPEAQMDRFIFKINVGYPKLEEEVSIIKGFHEMKNRNDLNRIVAQLSEADIARDQDLVKSVHMEEKLIHFIAQIVQKTRVYKDVQIGASPRASLAILAGSKAMAIMRGRDFVTPEDILSVVTPVLVHRISLTPEKEMEGMSEAAVIDMMIKGIEVPR